MYTLRQARKLRDKTQGEMAEFLGVCRTTYCSLEKDPEQATVAEAKKISQFLDIPVDQIFFATNST